MKVDVITRHSVPNYGSLLQTYATQKVIKELGYDCEIINYTKYEERYNNLADTLLKNSKFWNRNKVTRSIYRMIQTPNYAHMYKRFKKYREKIIKETKEYGSLEELKNDIPDADIYCSGSDQIWGKIGTENFDKTYFLDFVPDDKKCIAYSASFGKEKISQDLDDNLEQLLKKYSRLLVRESSAVEIIKNKGINCVEQVLDPTFLLSKEDWEKQIKTKNKYKNYILVYQLHDNKEFDDYAKKLAKNKKMKLLRISPSIYHITRSGKLIWLPNLSEFLMYFRDANYILTDSFHATVFSIIFNKKFIDILPGNTSTRITSILNLLGIDNRILKSYKDFELIENDINYSKVNELLIKEKNRSIKLLEEALKVECNNIDLMNKYNNCCGCRTCEKICPKNAIKMLENNEGFIEPVIDKTKCINCGICFKKCPQLNDIEINDRLNTQLVYAAKSKNLQEQLKSSSGGIFTVLANYVINNNGVVCGCAFNEDIIPEHIIVNDIKELDKLKGSKYVQSNTKNTYIETKKYLEEGKIVLYVGTPCQIAGLRKYLSKEYLNLVTCDLVCHGVPSPKLFKKHIKYLEIKNGSKIKEYSFRNKDRSVWGLNYKYKTEKNAIYGAANIDAYYKSFLEGKTYRECCYNCKYATIERIGDITLADYWGIEKEHPDFYDENGISAIILNTEKGKEIFENIKNSIEYIESNLENVKRKNHNLCNSTNRPESRNYVYSDLDNKSYKKIMQENLLFRKDIKDIIKNIIPTNVKKIGKEILKK